MPRTCSAAAQMLLPRLPTRRLLGPAASAVGDALTTLTAKVAQEEIIGRANRTGQPAAARFCLI
jgi:hypothetical protein